MKKIFNKKVLFFILLIIFMFTIVAYAYTEGGARSIRLIKDDIVFIGYDENEYHHNISYIMHKAIGKYELDKKNKETAESFNIDLNSYTEISRDNSMFKEALLFLLCPQVEATRGDSIPTIFLDETNSSGFVLKQDKNGLNYKYSFVKQGDRWAVIDKEVSR